MTEKVLEEAELLDGEKNTTSHTYYVHLSKEHHE